MSWTELSGLDSRVCFIAECLRSDLPMSMICERHGISRKTGYKWLSRYKSEGAAGLLDRHSAPHVVPNALEPAIVERIVALRRERPSWGPRKLLARLKLDDPGLSLPAASTVGDYLARYGLTRRRVRRRPAAQPVEQLITPFVANESWLADFKGWFRTGDGVRCEPLTITDNFSRYLLVSQAVPKPTFAEIKPLFMKAFQEYGLPRSLRTDNGSPFASPRGLAGLSQFSVWLLKLDIWPERIRPGRPDQNGRHERMHRTLHQEVAIPRSATIAAQQQRMDQWRQDFNTLRPHEALGQVCPATVYTPSLRSYPVEVPEWDYPADHHTRRVDGNGYARWQDQLIYVSEALAKEHVAFARRDDGKWILRFRGFDLAVLDDQAKNLSCSALARSGQGRTA